MTEPQLEPQLVNVVTKNIIADPILLHGGPESIELFCRKFHAMVLMEIINNLSKISYVSATTFSIAGKLSQHWRNAFIIRFVDWFPETGKQTFLTEELRNYFISRGFTIEYGYIRNEETEHLPCLMKQTGFLNEVKFYLIIKPNKLFFWWPFGPSFSKNKRRPEGLFHEKLKIVILVVGVKKKKEEE